MAANESVREDMSDRASNNSIPLEMPSMSQAYNPRMTRYARPSQK